MSSQSFAQIAEAPVRKARLLIEDGIAGLSQHEAYLALRSDFEEVLREDHGLEAQSRTAVFRSIESIPDDAARLSSLIHMAASYIVARDFGIVKPFV